MKPFNDSKQRTWQIALNIGSLKRVKQQTDPQVDLLDPAGGKPPLTARLSLDDALLAGVLWAILEPEATRQGVSPEDFAEALDGKTIGDAREALFAEWKDFFRDRRTETHAVMIEKQVDLVGLVLAAATKKLTAVNTSTLLQKIGGDTSTSAPASQESSPGPSPPPS